MVSIIRSREFPDLWMFRAFTRLINERKLLADTLGRQDAAGFLAAHVKEKIGHPDLLPPALAPATITARQKRWGHYAYEPSPDAGDTSTLLWTGRLKNSITYGNVALNESGVGSDDPVAVYHELGSKSGKGPPQRSLLASTAKEKNDEAFMKYADRLINVLFNV